MFEAVVLGIIQGLTEYLPVSSTAHLILFTWVTGTGGVVDSLSFDVALHIGTLIAVIVYFRGDLLAMLTSDRKLLARVALASVPAGAAGFLLNDFVETALRDPLVIATSLIAIAFVMWVADRAPKGKELGGMTTADAVSIGFAQILALIPGVSRSGITISAALFRGMTRAAAARFSFLLSTPIIAGATCLHGMKILGSEEQLDASLFLAGVAASGISGFLAISFLMRFLRRHTLRSFVYYRVSLGIAVVAMAWTRA